MAPDFSILKGGGDEDREMENGGKKEQKKINTEKYTRAIKIFLQLIIANTPPPGGKKGKKKRKERRMMNLKCLG